MNNHDINQSTQQSQDRIIAAHELVWPDEDVVRFFGRTFAHVSREKKKSIRVMDLGFGTGRHLYYLGLEGYDLYGLDYASSAIDKTTEMLRRHGLSADLRQEDLRETTFLPRSFDAILAWGVLYLVPLAQIREHLVKAFTLLEPGGWLCAKFRTTNNWFYGLGKEMEPNGYFLDDRAGVYAGNYYHFFSRDELVREISNSGFTIENLEYKEWHKFGREIHSYWMVWAKKP